jgi:ribokinase
MSRVFVAGLINLETTLAVDGFPIPYFPVRYPYFGVQTTVSGVGYNIAKALTTLGDSVHFASIIGKDGNADLVRKDLARDKIPDDLVLNDAEATAQSVIIYDPQGKRQIHTDLKDIQNLSFPEDRARPAIEASDLAAICNINFSRPLLAIASQAGKWIATDVHALSDLGDEYNRDYMAAAQILFLSDESLPAEPEEVARQVMGRFGSEIVVIGLGAKGALLAVRRDDVIERVPAVSTRAVINTIGAGDALFSAFLHSFLRTRDPYTAIRTASIFASYKIGTKGAADGFLTREELEIWVKKVFGKE